MNGPRSLPRHGFASGSAAHVGAAIILSVMTWTSARSASVSDASWAACPSELPSTPTGRIAAMRARVEAMLQAVQVARPALDKFYQSLSDEQKEWFNVIDQDVETTGQWQAEIALCRRAERDPGPLLDRTEQ
jgi:hypothetical protein